MVVVAGIARGVVVGMLDKAKRRFELVVMIDNIGVCCIWILCIDGSGLHQYGWARGGYIVFGLVGERIWWFQARCWRESL
jgi:hypothetical protein